MLQLMRSFCRMRKAHLHSNGRTFNYRPRDRDHGGHVQTGEAAFDEFASNELRNSK